MDRGGLEGRRRPPTPEGHTVTEKLCVLSKGCEWFVNTTVGYDKTALVVLFLKFSYITEVLDGHWCCILVTANTVMPLIGSHPFFA